MPLNKDAKILDIGCGMGRFLLTLKEYGYNDLSGVDIDDYQISIAQKENLNVELSDASEYLDKHDEKYDAIYCMDILEHIKKDEQIVFLKKINEKLNDNGILVIRVPNAISPTGMYYRYIDFSHIISYTKTSLNFLLKNAGFEHFCFRAECEESREMQILKKPYADLYKLQFGMEDIILTPNMVAVVFKDKTNLDNYLETAIKFDNNYDYLPEEIYLRKEDAKKIYLTKEELFNKLSLYTDYLRCLLLSKILFGKKRKHYKKKRNHFIQEIHR